jgi:hypothetical protein
MDLADQDQFVIRATDTRIERDESGRLILHREGQSQPIGSIMSAFPLTRPGRMISLRDLEGEEIGTLDDVNQLEPASRGVMADELERTYFMPTITDILDVQEDLGVVTWEVDTNRGHRHFQVRRVRQNIRKMGNRRLVIKDVDGNRYEVRDWLKLQPLAQKLIQNYL